jgi:CMP-N,N'-diacetyllegionaminic acid synthase
MATGRIIATVCARGGSKGLPGKNLLLLGGVSLLGRAIESVSGQPNLSGVFVSTDSPEMAAEAQRFGAKVPMLRPAELATDTAPKLPVVEHMVTCAEAELGPVSWVVDVQPTTPLRHSEDVQRCVDAAMSLPESERGLVTTVYDPGVSPFFTQVTLQPNGRAQLCMPSTATRRQDAPAVWALNGAVYLWWRPALAKAAASGLWSVPVHTVPMPLERSVDVDTRLDFEWAEFLWQRQHAGKTP